MLFHYFDFREGNSMKDKVIKLFTSTFIMSTFTFGGGFVIVSLYQKKFVEELKWVSEDEMLDIVSIAQSSPGPIPVNASVILGYRMAGLLGTFAAVLGTILPPFIIMSLISTFYVQFKSIEIISALMLMMRAGVAAVIFDVVYGLAKNVVILSDWFHILLMIGAFIAVVFLNANPITIILISLAIGITLAVVEEMKGGN